MFNREPSISLTRSLPVPMVIFNSSKPAGFSKLVVCYDRSVTRVATYEENDGDDDDDDDDGKNVAPAA
nr:hypothetical protein CFP56_76012 [Quercus suber]